MAQCRNHEAFVDAALDWGWELWEYGIDSSCEAGGDAPHLAPIWLKPCVWDEEQKVPVGCLCCTDLDKEILQWNIDLIAVSDNYRLVRNASEPGELMPRREKPVGGPVDWLPPYSAR